MHPPTATLAQLNLVVRDIRASAAFYRRLGVVVAEPPAGTEPFHAECGLANDFQLDLDAEAFARVWNAGWAGRADLAGRVVVGFDLASREAVDETYQELTGAGHRGLAPPFDAFWGSRYAIVEDPDGIAVGLMSPIDQAKRHWPPAGWPDAPQ